MRKSRSWQAAPPVMIYLILFPRASRHLLKMSLFASESCILYHQPWFRLLSYFFPISTAQKNKLFVYFFQESGNRCEQIWFYFQQIGADRFHTFGIINTISTEQVNITHHLFEYMVQGKKAEYFIIRAVFKWKTFLGKHDIAQNIIMCQHNPLGCTGCAGSINKCCQMITANGCTDGVKRFFV